MKITLSIITFILCISPIMSQKDVYHVLRKYKNDQGVVSYDMEGDFTNLFKDRNLKSKLTKMNILVMGEDFNFDKSDQTEIDRILNNLNYELLINVKNVDGKIKLYAIDTGKYLSNLYLMGDYQGKKILVTINGVVYFEELSQLSPNIDGTEEIFKQLKD
ncbi:MAG: DUF4252 domain-containing protein [Saprospiraceae bacterium]|nr:DUF4252 domain-containing protein [Saprospiraceae bacterium]